MASALLLIDIQNDYFPDGALPVEGSGAAAARAAELLAAWRRRDWPLVHIRHESVRPGAGFLLPGTIGAEIHPALAPMAGEPVVVKHYPNGFRATGLAEILAGRDVDNVVVAGMMTQMCIDATVRAAFDRGLICQVAADACAARAASFGGQAVPAAQVHAAFLAALDGVFARVRTVAELLPS